jgi:hypothetical protein
MKAIAESATKRFLGCHAKNPARYVRTYRSRPMTVSKSTTVEPDRSELFFSPAKVSNSGFVSCSIPGDIGAT